MLVGLNLPNYGPLGTRDAVTAIAERAEALGYTSLWTSDHVLLPTSEPEPFGNLLESLTTLTWIAAHTRTIRLATGILVLPQRDPLLVAKQAATLHHLSGGRLTLGVGAGWIEREYAFLRADFHHRGQLEGEYIGALRALFEHDHPAFHGAHIEFDDALFSPRPASPLRIVVGGDGPAALRRAAALGDGWHGLWRTPDQVRHARDALATATRRPFTISVRTLAHAGDTLTGPQAATALHGSDTDITTQAAEFAAAGVDELVIEPQTDSLGGFLDQITRLATLITPVK
jgi:probable F420-dependent oxidoreductase